MKNKKTILFIIIFVFSHGILSAQEDKEYLAKGLNPLNGLCTHAKFFMDKLDPLKVDDNRPLRIANHRTPVYSDQKMSRIKERLKFGTVIFADRISNSSKFPSILIRGQGSKDPLGWVHRDNLLCAVKPLVSPKGLEDRKSVV